MTAIDDFTGWETETLQKYVSSIEAFMIGSMQEDPLSCRYAIRLQVARNELTKRGCPEEPALT